MEGGGGESELVKHSKTDRMATHSSHVRPSEHSSCTSKAEQKLTLLYSIPFSELPLDGSIFRTIREKDKLFVSKGQTDLAV